MDLTFLILSTFCFFLGFAYTLFALGRGRYHPSRLNFSVMLAGFIFQTFFLYIRGQKLERCPLTNLFEVIIFMSWSLVLIYLLIGTSYRLSLLGVFTSPLVFTFQVFALLAQIDTPSTLKPSHNPWLSMHASLSMVAYGAFALSCVAGGMYLVQAKQLKTHRLRPFFFDLPPIGDLAVVINRLLLLGFVLLTIGLIAVGIGGSKPGPSENLLNLIKVAWLVGVWLLYAAILVIKKWRRLSPRYTAALAVVSFALALSTLWGLNFISEKVHF